MTLIRPFSHFEDKHKTNWAYDGFQGLKKGVRLTLDHVVKPLKTPRLALKFAQFTVKTLSLIPTCQPTLKPVSNVIKECKDYDNFLKGIRAVDGALNPRFNWKAMTLTVAGISLFTLSCLTMGDKFKFIKITPIKTALTALPLIGVLPFGGVLHISLVVMFGILFLMSLENRGRLKEGEKGLQKKIDYWTKTIDGEKIAERLTNYETKISALEKEIEALQCLRKEGEAKTDAKPYTKKALNEIVDTIDQLSKKQAKHLKKKAEWEKLDTAKSEALRNAKLAKWQERLAAKKLESVLNRTDLVDRVTNIVSNIIYVGTTLSGYGEVVRIGIDVGVGLVGCACALNEWRLRKKISQIKPKPVELESFLYSPSCVQIKLEND